MDTTNPNKTLNTEQPFTLTDDDLANIYDEKYGRKESLGWGPKLRMKFGYYSPDEYYEAAVAKLMTPQCAWIDVGCGRHIFPSNPELAKRLSNEAEYLLGVDPDENIQSNPFIHEAFQGPIEDVVQERDFDLVTFRMVAEHIENPVATLNTLNSILKPGGYVVIYTPHKYAPISIVAKYTPMKLHHTLKKIIWDTEERDTFPVQYKMNTHKDLKHLFYENGFEEIYFAHIDDCRATGKFYFLNYLELSVWKLLNKIGLHYPETCILTVCKKK